jgi:hypothetical protein
MAGSLLRNAAMNSGKKYAPSDSWQPMVNCPTCSVSKVRIWRWVCSIRPMTSVAQRESSRPVAVSVTPPGSRLSRVEPSSRSSC